MKTLLALFLLTIASVSLADEACSVAITTRFGTEVDVTTRYSYSRQAACSDANWECRRKLSEFQSRGMYYDATCVEKYQTPNDPTWPYPPTRDVMCTADMVDAFGRIVRSYTDTARTEWEACRMADDRCNYALSRGDTYGRRCVRGGGGTPPQPPRPPRETTETCRADRHDPAGYFIESYMASYTGPIGTDVRGEACRRALSNCSSEIRGRQTCRVY